MAKTVEVPVQVNITLDAQTVAVARPGDTVLIGVSEERAADMDWVKHVGAELRAHVPDGVEIVIVPGTVVVATPDPEAEDPDQTTDQEEEPTDA